VAVCPGRKVNSCSEYRWFQLGHLPLRNSSPPFQDAVAHHFMMRCVLACLCSPFGVGCTSTGVTGPAIPLRAMLPGRGPSSFQLVVGYQYPSHCLLSPTVGRTRREFSGGCIRLSAVLGGYLCVCASDSHEPPFPGDQMTTGAPNRTMPNIFRILWTRYWSTSTIVLRSRLHGDIGPAGGKPFPELV
jgi:hypothetical protein